MIYPKIAIILFAMILASCAPVVPVVLVDNPKSPKTNIYVIKSAGCNSLEKEMKKNYRLVTDPAEAIYIVRLQLLHKRLTVDIVNKKGEVEQVTYEPASDSAAKVIAISISRLIDYIGNINITPNEKMKCRI